MPENSSFIFDSSSRIQNLHKFFVSNQQKSLGIIVFTFILISSLEFILLLLDLLKNETNQWFRLTKIAIDLTNSIILGFLAKTFPTKIYKAKNYLAYVCLWVFILNEIGFGYAEAFDTENFHETIKTFFTLLVIKVLVLQMMCLLLSIGKIFQLIPLILMGILSLGFIAHNISSLKLFIESSICFTAFVFMVLMMTLRKEYLYKMISSSIEEVTFCKDIIKTIPIGVLLVDREYKIIYQNNQMANYFDTLPPDIRSPQNLFRQFKGAEIPEESLATLFKDAINQKFEGEDNFEVCLEDVLDIMFKNHKVVANALRGTNPSEPNSLQNSIKFFMKNLDTMIQVKVYPTHVRQKDCALLLFLDRNERNAPLLGAFGGEENNTHYLFLASLSHELRTPLNSALALIQSSVQELTIPEEVKEKLLIPALTSIQILSYNIKDIIDYSKMSYGALGLRLETCNVPALVERIMKLVEIQAKKKKISILSKIDPDVPLEWCTDPERVCQTILNLLSNGLKYTLKGSIVVCVKYMKKQGLIKVKVSDTGLGIESSELVKLQKNLKDQELFSKKINLHSTGIGLGLSVSNHICAALGPSKYDYLRVKSVFNKGSEFMFYIENKTKAQIMSVESPGTIETHESLLTDASNFRLKGNFTKTNHKYATRKGSIFSPFRSGKTMKDFPSKEPEISDGKLEESSDDSSDSSPSLYANTTLLTHQYLSFESSKNKLTLNTENPVRQHSPLLREVKIFNEGKAKNSRINRVLIVDDDSFNILSLELIFKKLRISHDHAYNGKEAIEKVLTNKYDLIMMDCNMPVMDGWEATKQILKLISEGKVKNLVIVACTAFEDAENLMKCVDAGMKYIIQKPVNIDKLSDLLKKFISD